MDEKLKKLIASIEASGDFVVKFVKSWIYLGNSVDSSLYDSYEDAMLNHQNYHKVLPVIVERKK